MKRQFFTATTAEGLTAEFRQLFAAHCKDAAKMAAINAEFKAVKEELSKPQQEESHEEQQDEKRKLSTEEATAALLKAAQNVKGVLRAWQVGSWLWAETTKSDETRAAMKNLYFLWNQKKALWFYNPSPHKKHFKGKQMSFEEITDKYSTQQLF